MKKRILDSLLKPQPASFRGIEDMSLAQWVAVPECPRQRDTDRHARKAIDYLQNDSPTHARVVMAVLPNGSRFKIDGHTRCKLWLEGTLPTPDDISVDVYDVPNMQAVLDLYDCFDNAKAAEDAIDRLSGAMREAGLVFKSTLMQAHTHTTALRFAHQIWHELPHAKGIPVNVLVTEWASAMRVIDAWDLRRLSKFTTSIVAGALLTARRDGEAAGEFWIRFEKGMGERLRGKCDAVQALTERAAHKKGGTVEIEELIRCAINGYEGYWEGYTYESALRALAPATVAAWCRGMRPRTSYRQQARAVGGAPDPDWRGGTRGRG